MVSCREEDLDADHPFWQVVGSIAGPAVLRLELARLDRGREAPAPDAAALHGLAAGALYSMNRFGEAAAHADRAVRLWDTDGTTSSGLGAALLISARMSTLLADPAAARAKALRAVEVLAPLGPSRELALGHSTLGSQDALQARFDAAVSTLDGLLGPARRVRAQDVVAHALIYRGVSRASLGGRRDRGPAGRLHPRRGQPRRGGAAQAGRPLSPGGDPYRGRDGAPRSGT